jgi:hypothetical protein
VRTPSKDQARRIGAELKRWSRRPVSVANARALGSCGILIVLALVASRHSPNPAAAIRLLAVMFAILSGTLHFLSLGVLRGLLRAGVGEARNVLDSLRDPRRISAFDIGMTWLLIAGIARLCE